MMDKSLLIATEIFFPPTEGFTSYEQYQILKEMRKTKGDDIASNHVYVHELLDGLDVESVMIYVHEFAKKIENGTRDLL